MYRRSDQFKPKKDSSTPGKSWAERSIVIKPPQTAADKSSAKGSSDKLVWNTAKPVQQTGLLRSALSDLSIFEKTVALPQEVQSKPQESNDPYRDGRRILRMVLASSISMAGISIAYAIAKVAASNLLRFSP
jgi:hypothetical protein